MSRNQKHRGRRKKKKKFTWKKCLIMLCLFVLVAEAAGFVYLQRKDIKERAQLKAEQEQREKELAAQAQQPTQTPQPTATPSPTPVDVRTVQNTATEENHKTNGLAICMYHYVYDKNNPPEEEINNNFIEVHALEKELKYLVKNEYYFPTWEEVRKYVDGDLLLPKKSVVLSFDDGATSFLKLGVPLFNKYKIPVTSFLITSKNGVKKQKKYVSDYVEFQSHSDDMHHGGGNIGHGGIFPVMKHDAAVADLKKSIEICKNGEAFAYPYGDYNDDCIKAVKDAGFLCAVTTEYGRAKPGDNPLLLPRMRMLEGQSLDAFISAIE